MASAALASLLLHGAVITVWNLQRPNSRPAQPAQRQAMEVLWIAAAPAAKVASPAPQPVARPAAPAQSLAKSSVAVARSAPRQPPAAGPAAKPPTLAGAALSFGASEPAPHAPGAEAVAAAAPAPQRAASDSVAPDGPVRWSAEAVGRADRQERAWQRRHGMAPAAQLAAQADGAGAAAQGAPMPPRQWRGGDGARVAQVQGPGGSAYCVRLPSANRLPELGAAPRVAPVTNCP